MKDIRYYYDASGKPVAIRVFARNNANESFSSEGVIYYLQTNLQGDVVAIYNKDGTKIYEYAYDAWGNIIKSSQVATGGNAAHAVNPFRYRGYYFDTETGLYYLQSRYYNPEWGRFLNADVYVNANGDLLGYNMFAYCGNNPVSRTDDGGMFWDTVFDAVSLCFSVADVVANPANPWAWAGLAGDIVDIVPFVSGVGEVTKAIGATIEVVNKADGVVDSIKVVKATDFTDEALDTIKTLKTVDGKTISNAVDGTKIHTGYKAGQKGKEFVKDANRFDFYDSNTIFELKPNNPKGIRDGIRQLRRYNKAMGGNCNLVLELY